MADDKGKQDGRDRAKIDGKSTYELDFMAKKHGVTREKVTEAIQAVGNSREKVEEYLKK